MRASRAFLICAMITAGLIQGTLAGQGAASKRRRKADPKQEQERGPYTFGEVLEGLKKLGPGDMERLIRMRKVTFTRSAELDKILKEEGGAPDSLLALIQKPLPLPKPKVAGDLTVICEPRDCVVVVDSRLQGATEKGRKRIVGLPVGEVEIAVFSDGYESDSGRVTLDEKPLEQVFTLRASEHTRVELGATLTMEMVSALGGLIAAAEMPSAPISGTASVITPSGPVNFSVQYTRFGSGGTVDVTGPNINCSAVLSREAILPKCKGKLKFGSKGVIEPVGQVARMLRDYELVGVLDRALAGKITAEGPDARKLKSERSAETLALQISADHLPLEIEIQPKQGSMVKVQYSDYATVGKGKYPRRTVVQQGGMPVAVFQFNIRK